MTTTKGISIFLFIASLIGLYVGISLTFMPAELQAQNNIVLENASAYSEARAPGMAILAASVFILIGAFKSSLMKFSLILSSLFFLSYGFGRLLSLALDGMPADGLFYAMFGELAVGTIAVILLDLKRKDLGMN
jgi:hypothetical protein